MLPKRPSMLLWTLLMVFITGMLALILEPGRVRWFQVLLPLGLLGVTLGMTFRMLRVHRDPLVALVCFLASCYCLWNLIIGLRLF